MNPRIFFHQISGLVIQAVLWITWCLWAIEKFRNWKLVYHTTKVCFQACHESTTKTSNHLIILWELRIPMREKKKVSKELKKEGENRQEHLPLTPCLGMSYYVNFLGGLGSNEFHIKWRFRHPWKLKKFKSWGPFRSYQLNSTANLAHFAQFLGKWAKLSVLLSW